MNSKNKQTNAIPFISFAEGKGFKLSEEAEEFLLNLPENRKLAIVSIVGKYRTGKSFFVNRVLLNQKKGGFQVGPTINPCTKGLWLWKKTVQSPSDEQMDVILIDTQGFGGMDENANHDSRIFLFSLLLSSYFIYNSVGSIDENALNTLNLIINLAKDIQSKTNQGTDDLSHFPSFLWIVRDFTLQMVNKHGENITSKEYLEAALQQQPGNTDAIHNKNKIRRLLRHFFSQRDCETMVRPIESEKDLQRLDEMDNSELRPQFNKQVEFIRNKIFSSAKAKKINGKDLNGHLLVALCKGYMEAINKGALPNVESAWYYVCRSEGLKAIKQASNYLQAKMEELLKNKALSPAELLKAKQELKQLVLSEFKKKSLGAEEGSPELLEKLNLKIEDNFRQLIDKNKRKWSHKYRQKTEKFSEIVRDKIFREEFEDFGKFVEDMERMKREYDKETAEGDSQEKWAYFNEMSEEIYRLAGQTISNKISHALQHEKRLMEEKLQEQEVALQKKQKQQNEEKNLYRQKIEELQKQKARLEASQETSAIRINQFKDEYDKLYEKNKKMFAQLEQANMELEKSKKQAKKMSQAQTEEMKSELNMLKNNSEKQKALHEMQKKYMQEELQRFKERCSQYESQNKKMRVNNARISSQCEDLEAKLEQKESECKMLQETNTAYSKKIETLLADNSKKSQILGEHNEWMLEKSYLQNQVSFLKNTLNENKKLHDTLLVALQQSIASTEGDCNNELVEANSNMALALQKMEQRCKILEEKYEKVKSLKRVFKHCTAMQCSSCGKWIQSSSFTSHLEQCGQNSVSLKEKTLTDFNGKQPIHISVSQSMSKETDEKKKPYLEYIIQIVTDENKWKVSKQYRQFTELTHNLITKFPSLKFPASFNQLLESKNLMSSKKNAVAEERRKNIQQFLRDLIKVEELRCSRLLKDFLKWE